MASTNRSTTGLRGICPICRREVSTLIDGTIGGTRHRIEAKAGAPDCVGYGHKALPLPYENGGDLQC